MLPVSSPNKFVALSKPIPDASVTTILVGVVVVAALYFGREVLVPIALAVLLSFILSPCVRLLQRVNFPRIVAVIVVGAVAFSAIFGLGTLMVSQVNGLARDLPRYQTTLAAKIDSLRGAAAGTGTLERASEVLHDLSQQINKPKGDPDALLREGATPDKPIPVEVRQPDPGALQTLSTLIEPLIHPLTTTGIVLIFVIFILLQHQDLRNRLIRLAGAKDLQRTTAAIDDAGERLSKLFLISARVERWVRSHYRGRAVVHRCAKRAPMGHVGNDIAVRPVHRGADFRDISAHPRSSSRNRLVNGPRYRRPLPGCRAHSGSGY